MYETGGSPYNSKFTTTSTLYQSSSPVPSQRKRDNKSIYTAKYQLSASINKFQTNLLRADAYEGRYAEAATPDFFGSMTK